MIWDELLAREPCNIVISIGDESQKHYFSWSGITSSNIECIEIDPKFMDLCGLKPDQFYSVEFVKPVDTRQISVESVDYDSWEILEKNQGLIEEHLLGQVRVVYTELVVPIWIHQSYILLKVLDVGSRSECSRLSLDAEIIVAPKARPKKKSFATKSKLSRLRPIEWNPDGLNHSENVIYLSECDFFAPGGTWLYVQNYDFDRVSDKDLVSDGRYCELKYFPSDKKGESFGTKWLRKELGLLPNSCVKLRTVFGPIAEKDLKLTIVFKGYAEHTLENVMASLQFWAVNRAIDEKALIYNGMSIVLVDQVSHFEHEFMIYFTDGTPVKSGDLPLFTLLDQDILATFECELIIEPDFKFERRFAYFDIFI